MTVYNKINFRYNEKLYAEQMIEKGFLTKFHNYELKILVKYYKYLGYKNKEIKELIYRFCKKHIQDFNRVKYFKIINSALTYGTKKKNKLIVIEKIPITDEEIKYINNLKLNNVCKKVLFTLLVQNKINKEESEITYGNSSNFNFFGGKKQFYREIKESSKIPIKYNIDKLIKKFSDNGIVDVRTRGKINLLFVYEIPKSENVVMEITTFDNIGNYFDWFNGSDRIIECSECGKFVRKTIHNRKYCKDCAKEKDLFRDRQYQRNKYLNFLDTQKNTLNPHK